WIASSIASMTIMRSMDFSRATASAICKSSNLFAETAMGSILLVSFVGVRAVGVFDDGFDIGVGIVEIRLGLLALARCFKQCVGQHQLGIGQKRKGQGVDGLGAHWGIGQPD